MRMRSNLAIARRVRLVPVADVRSPGGGWARPDFDPQSGRALSVFEHPRRAGFRVSQHHRYAWYDNEWGYAARMVDMAAVVADNAG